MTALNTTAPEVAGLVEEMRAGLAGVTPAPWTWGMRYVAKPIQQGVSYQQIAQTPEAAEAAEGSQWERDAAHIARCSPDNIAKLLDLIEDLAAERDRVDLAWRAEICRAESLELRAATLTADLASAKGCCRIAVSEPPGAHKAPGDATLRSLNKEDAGGPTS